MSHSREIIHMEKNQLESGKDEGILVTRKNAFLCSFFYVGSIIIAGWLGCFLTAKTLVNEGFHESVHASSLISNPDLLRNRNYWMRKAKPNPKPQLENFRLPTSVIPHSYELKLIPFFEEKNFTFRGDVKISIDVLENTHNVTLHGADLKIKAKGVTVSNAKGENIEVDHLSEDTSHQFHVIHTKQPLSAGQQYSIHLKFSGQLKNDLRGFYRASYNSGNTTRWIATTQFQPTGARRAFPCFDEPALKAKFKIFIGRPNDMISLSNMPMLNTGKPVKAVPNYVWDEYEESVAMSTYLVAFIVCDFEHVSDGNKFSVWVRKEAKNQTQLAVTLGPKLLKHYESYFGIDLPLPKMDMVGVPDFGPGAMENWGLLTFRETLICYDPKVSSTINKHEVGIVIAHELSHQWFGNLVTPSWWSDLWLNEGFASYMMYVGLEAVEPTWKAMDKFVSYMLQEVLRMDALKTSHPISVEVSHPDEIDELFDSISYLKGASLIRMMDNFLTNEVFKQGITNYLNRHKFNNTKQDDLWEALTEQAKKDHSLPEDMSVKTIMDTWTLQTGFPLVTVIRDYNKNTATVQQERFFLYKPTPKKNKKPKPKTLWWVPISYTTSKDLNFKSTKPTHWMKKEESIELKNMPSKENWVLLNIQQTGYYRVNYDENNWKLLIEHLKNPNLFTKIHPINRAQLVDDAMHLAKAEILSYETVMDITSYLAHETEYLPWDAAFTGFIYVEKMLIKTESYDKFKAYLLKIIQPLYDKIGFQNKPNEGQTTIFLRTYMLKWACKIGHTDCEENSMTVFKKWKEKKDPDKDNPVNQDVKDIVYCTAIRKGDENDWDFLWKRFLNSNVASEKNILLFAMGCSRDTKILKRAINLALTENSGVKKQDLPLLIYGVGQQPVGESLIFELITKDWDKLKAYVGDATYFLGDILASGTNSINTKSQRDAFENFVKNRKQELGPAKRKANQILEEIDANIRWMDINYKSLIDWISKAK